MKTDINIGLTAEEVAQQTAAGLTNESVGSQSKTIGQIVAGNVFTYFNLIFAIFAGLLIMVRSYINMTFLPIIVINTLIGIVQEVRAKKVLDRLNLMSAPKASVLREGSVSEVLSETLVCGDICIFKAGSHICADACVAEGSVRVNEALVTGEEDEIIKNVGDKLLSGSFVVSGNCKAQLEQVGHQAYAAKIMLEAKASRKKEQTEMMRSLDKLVKVIGVLIIPLGVIMFLETQYVLGNTLQQSVVAVVAALVGMIPEGLYLLASIALVVSVMRLGKQGVLLHEMACVETLARVDVLCVDKTGTITDNKMSVSKVIYLDADFDQERILKETIYNLNPDNLTITAIKEYFETKEALTDYRRASEVYSFSSEVKYSAVVMDDCCYVLGAPENVLLDNYDVYYERLHKQGAFSGRTLIFGVYQANEEERKTLGAQKLVRSIVPIAAIVLANPIRKEAKDTFAYFAKQGVEIKVISGDNPQTVADVAGKAGIENAESAIDLSKVKDDAELAHAASHYTVFGRVNPEQKKKLVKALQKEGKVVAMTGDGVNDVLALKSADCSVAFGSGSDAAANAAQIVLLHSDFSKMPSVVMEGRRVVNNIQRSASLFLIKNIFSMLLTLFVLFSINRYPLYPTQLSLLGMFTIGAPAFLLALQPNKEIIRGKFIVNVIIKALPAAVTDFLIVLTIMLVGEINGIYHEQLSTMTAISIIAIGVLALIRICRPFDKLKAAVCITMIAGIVLSIWIVPDLFAIYPLTGMQMVTVAMCIAVAVPVFIAICAMTEQIVRRYKSRKEKEHVRTEG